jgi:hypothetical protein
MSSSAIPELATVAVSREPGGEPVAFGVVVSAEKVGSYDVEVVDPKTGSAAVVRLPHDRLRVRRLIASR